MKKIVIGIVAVAVIGAAIALFYVSGNGQHGRDLTPVEQALKDDVPRIVCLNENFATGGQPKDEAYGKLAANGFRAVLNLRTAAEGVDLAKEKQLVEQAGLRYHHLPVVGSAPQAEQVPEFIRIVKDNSNQPLLIHCASANRVGAMWLIYRVLEQGWPEEKALEEATKIGLTSPGLKKFAQDYIANHRPKS